MRRRGAQRTPSGDTTSHFATDREVDMRILNPSTSISSHSSKLKHSNGSLSSNSNSKQHICSPSKDSKKPNAASKIPLSINRVVSKKKIASPSKSMKRKEHSSTPNKRRLQVLHLKISPRSKSKGRTQDKTPDIVQSKSTTSKKLSPEKPWRQNMRFQSVEKAALPLPEETCATKNKRKHRTDAEEVKEYMKSKSDRLRAQSREERIQSFQRKEKIKNRLEELETRRKEKVLNSSPPKKNFCPIHGYDNPTPCNNDINKNNLHESPESMTTTQSHGPSVLPSKSAVDTLKEVQKMHLNNQLFLKLEELTKELHQSSSHQYHCHGPQTTNQLLNQIPEKPYTHKLTLSEDAIFKKASSKAFNSIIKTSESNKHLATNKSSKPDFLLPHSQNDDKGKKGRATVDKTTSPIESLIHKHEKDINFIKKMDSNLLPSSLKSDHFNFISTVKRKLTEESSKEESKYLYSAPQSQPPPPFLVNKTTSISEDTLSEGPLSTSLASLCKKSCSSSSVKDKSKALSSTADDSTRSKISVNKEIGNESIKALSISTSDFIPQKCEDVKDGVVAEFVPNALHLRFLAELNQFETVQSAEKQIDKLDRIKDISTVRQDAATMAHIIQGMEEASKLKERRKKSDKISKRESRAEFEARIRKDINQLFHDKFMHLIESQTEATRVTANATQILASFSEDILEIELQNKNKRDKRRHSTDDETLDSPTKGPRQSINTPSNASIEVVSSQTSKPSVNVPEEVISLISKTESSIPEVLSVLEKASQSGNSIRQTISEVMSRKNDEECPSSSSSMTLNTGNITEEIEKEISIEACLTSPLELSQSQVNVEESSLHIHQDDDNNILNGSSSEFTLNMIEQHILVESRRANNQYILLKLKEKKIVEKAMLEMTALDKEKKTLKLNNQDTSHISKKQKMIISTVKSQRKEIKNLKDKLKVAERERQFVLSQQRKLLLQKKGIKEFNVDSISDLESPELLSSIHQGKFIINDLSISSSSHPKENMIPKTLIPSHKDTTNSRGSESFEESLTNISISSDHSDAAIRVNALKDELQRQKSMAKKLKEQQKVKNKESFQVQEESLKKKIETYDKLIVRISDKINHQEVQTSSDVVPPQIKTPGNKSRSSSECDKTMSNKEEEEEMDHELMSNKTSISDTIETEAISPDYPSLSSSSKVSTVISDHTINHNKKVIDEKVVGTLCGSIFKTLLSDTCHQIKALKNEPDSQKKCIYNPINEIKSGRHSFRPQDLLLTTFDVDSEESVSEAIENDDSTPNGIAPLDDDLENIGNAVNNDHIDDDFGLNSIRKESEELRQQQILIEEEINRIHEESTTELDKPPPPPYIVKTSNLRRRPAIVEVPNHLLSAKKNLKLLIPKLIDGIHLNSKGDAFFEEVYKDLNEESLYEEPLQFLEALYDTLAERMEQFKRNSKQNPPWMKQKPLSVIHKSQPLNEKGVLIKEILDLFGRGDKTRKDRLALRCLKKMKKKQGSNVEYILATELYREEDHEWNNYDDEETRLKDALTSDIFDYLLKDTIHEINAL